MNNRRRGTSVVGRWGLALGGLIAAVVVYLIASLFAPTLLLFPYSKKVDGRMVYSEVAIPDSVAAVLTRSDALVRRSELFEPEVLRRPVFLTQGGWRWHLLSFDTVDAFAQTRPFGENVVVNRSDVSHDRVSTGPGIAGTRRLSDVIAHERTHVLIRMAFGAVADKKFPRWLREGYCDHVAGSSTLSEAQAAELTAQGSTLPALAYYQSRRRVERELQANGGNVRSLFETFVMG